MEMLVVLLLALAALSGTSAQEEVSGEWVRASLENDPIDECACYHEVDR